VLGGPLGTLAALSALFGPNAGGMLGGAHQKLLQPLNTGGKLFENIYWFNSLRDNYQRNCLNI
jgi:hypothetical protein